MIEATFEYNGLTINQSNLHHLVEKIEGLGSPSIRETRGDRPAMDGQKDYLTYLGERMVTIDGAMMCTENSDLITARDDLKDAFITDGNYYWLKWQLTGELAKQLYCKVLNLNIKETIYKGSGLFRAFRINLIAVDPRIYSQAQESKNIYIPSSVGGMVFPMTFPLAFGTVQTGGKLTIRNDGNYSVLPTVRFYGPLTNPKIRNNDDSAKEILVNLVVADGDWLEIDFEEKTIMLNGTASRYNYLDSDSEWWEIKPDNNEIEFRDSGGDTSAYAHIIYRHGWI